MVSTRNHPSTFPSPSESPSKFVTRSATKPRSKRTSEVWTHTPSNLTLLWLAISLPLVIWDTGYVLLRPYSMPGGSLHWPIWVPYALYGEVDYIYSFPALEAHNGFTAAQGTMNLLETIGYMVYLWMVWRYGSPSENTEGTGAPSMKLVGWIGQARTMGGAEAGAAALICFSVAIMTLSKTVLYWLNEYWSGFDNIGHNDILSLIFLWIIPNGAWIAFPTYMVYVFGQEILEALAIAGGDSGSSMTPKKILAIKNQ